ncbi:MAG TPA: LacI family DNA-binding transcriptional regulator [Opitutaceae bacterium]|nr:LacI family DNA-binding transcriptional regulator [Opitutaceae bacterium]
MKVTMADVARAARVSRATVSLALRHRNEIPESTRRKVHAAAQRLGYVPHPLVSALMATRRGKNRAFQASLAFLTAFPTKEGWRTVSQAYAALFAGAQARAQQLGYALHEVWLRDPRVDPRRQSQILQARGVQGLLVAPLPAENAVTPAIAWEAFSVLAVGYSVREPAFHRISHDYFHGMSLALQQCRAKGYRRIGFFLDRRVSHVIAHLWHAAYLAEQNTTPGVEAIEPLLAERWDDPQILRWLKQQRLDALICLDAWRLQAIHHVPASLPLICLNTDESPHPLPGIRRDFSLIGHAAIDRLVSLVQTNQRGTPDRVQTVLLEGEWTHGDRLSRKGQPLGTLSQRGH